MTKKTIIFLLIIFNLKVFSQQKRHTIFNKDSLINVTNYIDKFDIIDSLVVKTGEKTLVISEKDIIPFQRKRYDESGKLGNCPFATKIQNFNKRLVLVTAIFRNSFSTSFYIFSIEKKTGKVMKVIKIESLKKGFNGLLFSVVGSGVLIPKKENFITSDSIKVLNENNKLLNIAVCEKKMKKEVTKFYKVKL